ncbi:MAG: alkaline phosphatase family protein [Anaerolineales bacterium]|nr:alkaline phosphatase family protein [Anaerolineales bacterium]
MNSQRILIFGVDGATFNLIRPWAAAGFLPNFARMLEQGVHGDLESTLPPVTSPAWPTFMTGCNPGKHGVFDFIRPKGDGFDLVNATSIRRPTIWQILSEAGLKVGAMNVPVTYPAQPVNGFMITGLLSPSRGGNICYPSNLIQQYEEKLGPYRISPRVQYVMGMEQPFIEDAYDLIDTHGRWGLHLMKHEPWNVFMLHFLSLDVMQHAMWRFMDRDHPRHEPGPFENAIRDGYARVDAAIGKMLDSMSDDTTVLVMSDHGFGPLHAIVNLNIYLMQCGLLKLKKDVWTQIKAAAFRNGITPDAIFKWLSRLSMQNIVARVSKNTRNQVMGKFLSYDSVDWSRTLAYSMGHVGQIYLNLAGREPHGIVTAGQYDQVLQKVQDAMKKLTGSGGRPLVTRMVARSEIYHGPYAEFGPDLHLELDEYCMISFPLFATNNQIVTQQIRGDSGCHRSEGILMAYGNGIRRNETITGAKLRDLAPTILHMAGLPVPSDMDGRVLGDLMTDAPQVQYTEAGSDAREQTGLSDDETAEVEERLRSLGYL